MRLHHALLASLLGLSLAARAAGPRTGKKFENDGNHTAITFKASTVLFDVNGWFDKYHLTIEGDPQALGPVNVKLEIEVKSINTNNKSRDGHLRSPDFFDAEKYPKIVFTGTKATREGDKVVVDGTLEMHGVKKDMKLAFTPVVAKNGAGIEEHVYKGEITISRKDFGIGADSVAAKISLSNEVPVKILVAGFFE